MYRLVLSVVIEVFTTAFSVTSRTAKCKPQYVVVVVVVVCGNVVVVVSAVTGAQLGAIISLPLSALLCHFIGWQAVFYAVGNDY